MIKFPVITSNEEFSLHFENSIWLEAEKRFGVLQTKFDLRLALQVRKE